MKCPSLFPSQVAARHDGRSCGLFPAWRDFCACFCLIGAIAAGPKPSVASPDHELVPSISSRGPVGVFAGSTHTRGSAVGIAGGNWPPTIDHCLCGPQACSRYLSDSRQALPSPSARPFHCFTSVLSAFMYAPSFLVAFLFSDCPVSLPRLHSEYRVTLGDSQLS